MTKINLPKEVADSIEYLKEIGWSELMLFDCRNFLTEANKPIEPPITCAGKIAKYLSNDVNSNLPLYMSALVNGYTVEQTPEEKVREYYDSNDWTGDEELVPTERQRMLGRRQGVRRTLDLLEIKIEGVNA